MGVNLALLGLENLRLDYTDPVVTPAVVPNLVLTDVIEDSGYDLLSNEGKALQRALFLGEPEVPEPTISLKQFIESFIQATADVFEARGFNNIADHLRSIHNFDRIIGEIEMRISKYEQDSIAQIDAIERFLALMPGISTAVAIDSDIDPTHVIETGTGAEVLASIDSKNPGTLKEWIQDLYVDLITDSMLAFDDSNITNPSGFDDGFGALENMKWVLETRNNETVPAAGTLDRTLYDAVSSIQGNWALIYEEIQSGVAQWSDYNNMGDFSGFNFSRLIDGQDFSDWTGSLISSWSADVADTSLYPSDYQALADTIRAKYEADLASDTHLEGFAAGALSAADIGGYFHPLPTDDPNELILESGKFYYNPQNGFFYTAVKDLTSGEVATYDEAVSYGINDLVYDPTTNALYRALTNTTVGIDPSNTSQWKLISFSDTSFWSLNADSTVQLSAMNLGIEKMIDDLADEMSGFAGDFSLTGSFNSEDLVYDEGEYYSLNAGETITYTGNVGDVSTYNRGDVITVDGTEYISLTSQSGHGAFSGSSVYNSGDTVTHGGKIWEYTAPVASDQPSYTVVGSGSETTAHSSYELVNGGGQSGGFWYENALDLTGENIITANINRSTTDGAVAFVLQDQGTSALGNGGSSLGADGISGAFYITFESDSVTVHLPDGSEIESWPEQNMWQGNSMDIAIKITDAGGGLSNLEVHTGGDSLFNVGSVDLSMSEAYYGFTSATDVGQNISCGVNLTSSYTTTVPGYESGLSKTLAPAAYSATSETPSASSTRWEDATSSTFSDTSKFLIYSGPILQFWTYEPKTRARINVLRAAITAALGDLNSDLTNPPGAITDIRRSIIASQSVVQSELDYYDSMIDVVQSYIDSTTDLTSAITMVEGILTELEPAVSGITGSLGTTAADLSTWESTLGAIPSDSGFFDVAQDLITLVTSIRAIYDAYNTSSTPTAEQVTAAKDAAESLRGETGSMTVNYVNYLDQWEALEDDFNALFPQGAGQFNPSGGLQAQAISALFDLMTHVSDLEGLTSGGGDPLYADIYFSMKNTFETLLSNLNFRINENGEQVARLIPVTGSGGMDEDAYFDAFRKILKHHSTPNSTAPLTLLYEYYVAIGDNSKATETLDQMINGGSDLSSSANPGLLSRLRDEFKELAEGIYMPGTDKRNICTTNGNEQKFLHTGSMEAMRDVYNDVKDDIATLMNEIDTALTRVTIGDTTSARFVNVADLAAIDGNRADGVNNFSDNAADIDIARELSEFNNYGTGSGARKYHASIATASTSLMSILSNFEFFFNGEMESDDGIWGSHVSTNGTPYAFTQHGKMSGRMQEQAYVFDYSNVLSRAKSDLGAKYDSKATWIMDDLLDMVEKGYDKAKDYYRDNVVERADNYWVEFNAFHLAVETEARRLVTSAFATTTPMEDIFYSVFESDDLTADEKRLLSKVLNMLMTLLVSMLGSNQQIRDVVQGLQRGETTLAQVSESITITESMANNMIERAMAMAADMLDQEKDSLESSGNYIGSDPISSQQYLDMASFYLGNVELNEALEQASEEQDNLQV